MFGLELELSSVLIAMTALNAGGLLFGFWGVGRFQRRSEVLRCQLEKAELEEKLKVAYREAAFLRQDRRKLLNKLIESRTVPPWADNAFGKLDKSEG